MLFKNLTVMVGDWLRKYKKIISPILAATIYEGYVFKFGLMNQSFFKCYDSSFHFNILQINAILAGFLFTGLSIMLSVSDKTVIIKINKAGYLEEIDNIIFLGIVFHLLSIGISILGMINVFSKLHNWVVNLEILTLILGLIFFLMSIVDLSWTIKQIRKNSK